MLHINVPIMTLKKKRMENYIWFPPVDKMKFKFIYMFRILCLFWNFENLDESNEICACVSSLFQTLTVSYTIV